MFFGAKLFLFVCVLMGSVLHSKNAEWWSRMPLLQPKVPKAEKWGRNPVDRFILQKLRAHDLSPGSVASPSVLIRRLTYDLTGLPPSPSELSAFEKEYASDPERAYEELVDRLLSSPRYGERFARHWLDVAKYADTCGYDKDKLRPHAWPYRDYVIRSFNQDKPYAQFVKEQIAGDFIYPDTEDGILGLGFLAAGPWDFIGHVEVPESKTDGKVARNLDRDDMVSNVFNSFCATTIQCARCHEHKGDPIGQDHYYSLQSVFAAVDKADRVYGLDPKVARKKEELSIQQGELCARESLSWRKRRSKKKGAERSLRNWMTASPNFRRVMVLRLGCQSMDTTVKLFNALTQLNGCRWIWARGRRSSPFYYMHVTMILPGSVRVLDFPSDLKLLPRIRKTFPGIKYCWTARRKTL